MVIATKYKYNNYNGNLVNLHIGGETILNIGTTIKLIICCFLMNISIVYLRKYLNNYTSFIGYLKICNCRQGLQCISP